MVMTVFGPFLFFSLLNALTVSLSKKPFGKCLPLTMILSAFVMFFSQLLLKTFQPGGVMLLLLLAGSLAFIWFNWRKKDSSFKKNYLSYGFWAFLAVYLLYLWIDFGRNFDAWDEFSHWGIMVKEMLRTDRFYSEDLSHLLVHKEYPPFVAVFEMLWCQICGRYSEMAVSMAIHVFSLSLLVPGLMEDGMERRGRKALGLGFFFAILFILVISAFDVYGIFHTIYTDMFMPVLYVYCMSLILTGDVRNTGFGRICFVCSLTALILSKQMAAAFVMLVWLTYFMMVFTEEKGWKRSLGKYITMVLALVLPAVNYGIWRNYTRSLGLTGQFDLGQVNIKTILAILTGNGTRTQTDTWKAYFGALFQRSVFAGITPMTYVSSFFVALLLLYVIWRFLDSSMEKRQALGLGLVFTCGTLGYAFTMFVLYMFCFAESEMVILASYERYMDSYVVSEFLILLILAVRAAERRFAGMITPKNVALFLCGSTVVLGPAKLYNLSPQAMKGNPAGMYYDLARTLVSNTEYGSSVLLLSTGGMPQNEYYINYFADGREISLTCAYEIPDFMEEGYVELIQDTLERMDYAFVINTSEEMDSALADLTGGVKLKENCVYQVEHTGDRDKIRLLEVTK